MTRIVPLLLVIAIAVGCEGERSRPVSKKRGSASASAAQVAQTPQAPIAPVVTKAQSSPVASKATTASTASTASTAPRAVAVAVEPKPAPKPPPAIIKVTCTSDKWYTDEEKAMDDALQTAQYEVMKKLQAMDPPVTAKPSKARIRQHYLKNRTVVYPTADQEKKLQESGLTDKRLQMTIDVELTEAQVQNLRAGDRVSDGIRGAGVMLAIVAAVFGFFRLDAWSKGYLTTWLGLGALAVVGAAVAIVLS